MYIQSKDWTARNDKMPGNNAVRVFGTVTVAHPGIQPVLRVRAAQDKSFTLALDLNLQQIEGSVLQVVTDKTVRFELPGVHGFIPAVDIFHEGELITRITDVIVTH
jgi:hypothetical protein